MTINVSITAPLTLLQYAQGLPENDPSRTFVENMVAESDVLAAIKTLPANQGIRAFMDIASLPAVGFRKVNTAGNESSGNFNLREEDTFFIDEYVKVDRAIIDRLGMEQVPKQEKLKTIALSQMISQQIIKGDRTIDGAQPNGLQSRCTTLNTTLFNNSAASGGAALSLANLDVLYRSVNKPTHWIFPRGLMPYMDAAARNNTLVNQTVDYAKDDFGRTIMKFKGLPILYGYEPDDSPDLMPFTEVASGGGSAVTASIYCVSFRDGGIYLIEQTPLSVMPEGFIVGVPFYSTHIKWDLGIAREHPRACSRLTSITAAAPVA